MSESKSSSGGVGFAGLLTIAFVVLKLCKVIDWSWVWVVSPIWISIGLVLLVLGGMGTYYLRQSYIANKKYEARRKRRESELNDLQNLSNELSEQINGAPQSKWQQRMSEIYNKQEAPR